ncbi:MAG: response regulator transcription factor [Chloroflexota bacterium]
MLQASCVSDQVRVGTKQVITIVIVDMCPIVRRSLVSLLHSIPTFAVVTDVATPEDAYITLGDGTIDIAMMDLERERDWSGVIERVYYLAPHTRIILFSAHIYPFQIQQLLTIGAKGIIDKQVTANQLITSIEQVQTGQEVVLLGKHVQETQALNQARCMRSESFEQLTPRELDALGFVVKGATNKEIAAHMQVTTKTIEAYLNRICAKLQVSSRTAAAVRGLQLGLVQAANVYDL